MKHLPKPRIREENRESENRFPGITSPNRESENRFPGIREIEHITPGIREETTTKTLELQILPDPGIFPGILGRFPDSSRVPGFSDFKKNDGWVSFSTKNSWSHFMSPTLNSECVIVQQFSERDDGL